MERNLNDSRMRFFIGDVRDQPRLELAMRGVDYVVHAAALKIVPIAEYNPTECTATNVGGAENVVRAAINMGVKRVITLSTDKAVNPINLYGASKLAAEKIFMAAGAYAAGKTTFSVVRYGNVHGSSGSVVPLFKKFAAEGKRLPITHRDMTRFWVSMEIAVALVISALKEPMHNCIWVPRVPSIRIMDLAQAIAPDQERVFVGMRPGEKIHEILITSDEARYTTDVEKFYIIEPHGVTSNDIVPQGFEYTSKSNPHFLAIDGIRKLL
jgi:UDP-N-acetylglucosamine 4,6-dehydratase